MSYTVNIKEVNQITHDVKEFIVEKPDGYEFRPGQATDVALNIEGWKDEQRPFTFTSLPEDDNLEFVIKIYDDHEGVTNKLDDLAPGEQFIIGDPWGAIEYKGPGTFIAGGAGITPFISIFRYLKKQNKLEGNQLLFSNKTEDDIILADEFRAMLESHFINVLTRQEHSRYETGRIDKETLKKYCTDFDQHFYICGPIPFVMDMSNALNDLGADMDSIIFEE